MATLFTPSSASPFVPLLSSPRTLLHFTNYPSAATCRPYHNHRPLRASNDESVVAAADPEADERSEADRLVDGVEFGELCNEFECISSPLVESTARQLARDILEMREGNRALGTFAVSVKYKDPLRAFTGREKYKRPLWVTDVLDKPVVMQNQSCCRSIVNKMAQLMLKIILGGLQEMVMLSTSLLSIKWTVRGRPKSFIANIGGDVIVKVNSQFTLNQISGQVIEHEESWDLSESSAIAQAYFWISRRIFSTKEAGKDVAESIKNTANRFPVEKENMEIYPDPSGDPTKITIHVGCGGDGGGVANAKRMFGSRVIHLEIYLEMCAHVVRESDTVITCCNALTLTLFILFDSLLLSLGRDAIANSVSASSSAVVVVVGVLCVVEIELRRRPLRLLRLDRLLRLRFPSRSQTTGRSISLSPSLCFD
ncbi:hypothetical protein Scep_029160 [Stephania cephalantha]|uniref:Uncharacterized protein n=1 Tax=Stephania cephalantha TaxID=152367 RepID=A0AAP0E4R5_9MAGN